MTITTVTATVKRLINLGNYENVTFECSATATVDQYGGVDTAYKEALDLCKEKVGIELERFQPSKKPKPLTANQSHNKSVGSANLDDEIPF